jgi:hypothetical protein
MKEKNIDLADLNFYFLAFFVANKNVNYFLMAYKRKRVF